MTFTVGGSIREHSYGRQQVKTKQWESHEHPFVARFVYIFKMFSLCFYWYYEQSENNLRKSSEAALTV